MPLERTQRRFARQMPPIPRTSTSWMLPAQTITSSITLGLRRLSRNQQQSSDHGPLGSCCHPIRWPCWYRCDTPYPVHIAVMLPCYLGYCVCCCLRSIQTPAQHERERKGSSANGTHLCVDRYGRAPCLIEPSDDVPRAVRPTAGPSGVDEPRRLLGLHQEPLRWRCRHRRRKWNDAAPSPIRRQRYRIRSWLATSTGGRRRRHGRTWGFGVREEFKYRCRYGVRRRWRATRNGGPGESFHGLR